MGMSDTRAFHLAWGGQAFGREQVQPARGAGFVAVVRLTDKAGHELAAPGQRCDRVPERSLGWLEAQGLIARRDHQQTGEDA